MFAITCPTENVRTLVFPSDVRRLRNTPDGIVIDFVCSCGAAGTWVTGRGVEERLVAHGRARVMASTAA